MTPTLWQLLLAAEVSPAKGRTLIEAFGPLASIDRETFAAHPSLTPNEATRVRACSLTAWQTAQDAGAEAIFGGRLPSRLTAMDDPPVALLCQGDIATLDGPCIGIVGTRNASAYGRGLARKFAAALAEGGVTIVSGGALGIDAAAHEGALSVSGNTVAVLGGGIDKPYPSQNAALFRRIQNSGCLLSAYACGTLPERYKFLLRNELIAALCDGILVVEAPSRSGALSTAFAARRFNRPVFVVPANANTESFLGSHNLVRSGSMLVDDPSQIAEALGLLMLTSEKLEPATGIAAKILAAMSTSPLAAEKLAEKLSLPPHELMAELTMLELDGRVTRELGGYALVP